MTRRDLGSSSSELSGISIAFSGDDAGGGLSPSSSELSELSGISIAFAGHDIVMACVRRLAGDGVYWDRLRVSGRVRGATCAAPRKNRPTSLRGAFPSSRAANLTTTRDAPPSAGPPPQHGGSRRRARRPAQRPAAEEQAAKKHGCVHQRSSAATRPRAAAKRSQPHGFTLRPLSRRSACRRRLWGVSLGVHDSRLCEVIFVRGSGVKTLA